MATKDLTGSRPGTLEGGGTWLNSDPLVLKDLTGKKVILIDFWTYSCVNCLRTLPHLKNWWEKYKTKGLVIIGVHTPEFEFEKNQKNVEDFCLKNNVTWPVVLDNDYKIWNSFANSFWPRKYLIDKSGTIVYDHAGEGDYSETEEAIQKALKKLGAADLPEVTKVQNKMEAGICYPQTPELYCGYERGQLGNKEGYKPNEKALYAGEEKMEEGKIYLKGTWEAYAEYLRYAGADERAENLDHWLGIRWKGLEANLVSKHAYNEKVRVYIKQDDTWLRPELAGPDVQFEGDESFIEVFEPRMYRLVKTKEFGHHNLYLYPQKNQFEAYAFTFGGCEHEGDDLPEK